MNRRTFMQKTGLIMSGLTLSPLIGKSYSSIYGQTGDGMRGSLRCR